ncbi:hypothetical protein Tco_0798321 [Tanacetum coccineum]
MIGMLEVIIISNGDTSLDVTSSDGKLTLIGDIPFSNSDSSSDSDSDSYDYIYENSSEELIIFRADHDLDWQFLKQTEEGYPKPQSASTSRVSNLKGKEKVKVPTKKKKIEPRYGHRSSGVREETIMVKKPYSMVKVTNAIRSLRAPNADV